MPIAKQILEDLTPIDSVSGEMERLFPGQMLTLGVNVVDDAGTPTNDPSIKLFTQEPSEATATENTTPAITNPATGRYEFKYTLQEGGKPTFRWESAGTLVGAAEFFVRVQHSQITKP